MSASLRVNEFTWTSVFSEVQLQYPRVSHQPMSPCEHILHKFTFLTPPAGLTPIMEWLHRLRTARSSPWLGILPPGWEFNFFCQKNVKRQLNTCKEICREVQIIVNPPKICLQPLWIVGRGNEKNSLANLVVLEPGWISCNTAFYKKLNEPRHLRLLEENRRVYLYMAIAWL